MLDVLRLQPACDRNPPASPFNGQDDFSPTRDKQGARATWLRQLDIPRRFDWKVVDIGWITYCEDDEWCGRWIRNSCSTEHLDCCRCCELGASESTHEIPTPGFPAELHLFQLMVNRTPADCGSLSSPALTRHNAVPVEPLTRNPRCHFIFRQRRAQRAHSPDQQPPAAP